MSEPITINVNPDRMVEVDLKTGETVRPENEDAAIDAAREMVDAEHIVLGPDDFTRRDYSIYSVEQKAKEVVNGKLG